MVLQSLSEVAAKEFLMAAQQADSGAQCPPTRGSVGPETALSALGERFLERRNWVGGGRDRFAQIELQMNTL